ncbi:MAG TPA: (2Fe-2S)-binding protein [Candidatus Limnocylindrales bacterium]|nr:(2Fe-2S)-binding protein [Candidatus Limnocylindrales bacterium]
MSVTINGTRHVVEVEVRTLLSDLLRQELGYTGTHVGCEHGVCGACTVLVDGQAVRSCLMLAPQVDGREILTVESLSGPSGLHPLQDSFRRHHGLQCGFCTPGILMGVLGEANAGRDLQTVLDSVLSGHLCRCTGYVNIRAAIRDAWPTLKERR